MTKPTTQSEPLRIFYGAATLIVAIYAPCAAYLASQGHSAQASLLAGIGTALAGLLATEGKRAVTDSPATKAAQVPLPVTLESLTPALDQTPHLTQRLHDLAAAQGDPLPADGWTIVGEQGPQVLNIGTNPNGGGYEPLTLGGDAADTNARRTSQPTVSTAARPGDGPQPEQES